MQNSSHLLFSEEIVHTYPHCWRCKKPIIFRATAQWFLDVDRNKLRERILKAIKKVEWIPKIGENRISSMVKERPDWCLSRQRYWGVPIPGFYCTKCNKLLLNAKVIENVARIVEGEGSDAYFTKDTQDLLPKETRCANCGNAGFKKERDIIDVWFESGVSHQTTTNTGTTENLN